MFKKIIIISIVSLTMLQNGMKNNCSAEEIESNEENATTLFKMELESDNSFNSRNINISDCMLDFSDINIDELKEEVEKEVSNIEMQNIKNQVINQVIDTAVSQLGKPYVWGATGGDSYDCSMLMKYSMNTVGITLPRTSKEQRSHMEYITFEELQRGDFIFWHEGEITNYKNVKHVAIYLGDGKMLHATPPRVTISEVAKRKSGKYNISYGRYDYLTKSNICFEF